MKSINDIQLGARAKDMITGFIGVVVAKTVWLNGCNRLMLQPCILKDGEPMDSWSMDIQQLEPVLDAPVIESTWLGLDWGDLEWGDVKLGMQARCLITGFTGIIISKTEFIGGKRRVHIQSQALHDGKVIKPYDFDVTAIEILDPKPMFGDIEGDLADGTKKVPGGPFPEPKP